MRSLIAQIRGRNGSKLESSFKAWLNSFTQLCKLQLAQKLLVIMLDYWTAPAVRWRKERMPFILQERDRTRVILNARACNFADMQAAFT